MSRQLYRPGSFDAKLQSQSVVENIQWEVAQSNLNLVATKQALENYGLRVEKGLENVSQRIDDVDRTLVEGFITLHADIMSVEGAITDLTAKFDWAVARLEAGIGGIRDTVEDLIRVAKSPEQTWAIEQYGIARDAYNRGLFPESLEHIERAIAGFESHTGYKLEHRFHHLLGMILRIDSEVRNLPGAESAYLAAARYAGNQNKWHAALAFMAAGHVAYMQGALDRALAHTNNSLALTEITEAKYQMAKFLMSGHKSQEALGYLSAAVEADPLYSLKCFQDAEFLAYEQEVRSSISHWRDVLHAKNKRMAHAAASAIDQISFLAIGTANETRPELGKLAPGGRFGNISLTALVEPHQTAAALQLQAPTAPYLDVRHEYDGRQAKVDFVGQHRRWIAMHIGDASKVLESGLAKGASWSEDGGAQFMTMALGMWAPFAFLAAYANFHSANVSWTAIGIALIVYLFVVFAFFGPLLTQMRASRVNRVAERIGARLKELRHGVEVKVMEVERAVATIASTSRHHSVPSAE